MCFFSCSVFKDLPRRSFRARFDNIPLRNRHVKSFFEIFFEFLFKLSDICPAGDFYYIEIVLFVKCYFQKNTEIHCFFTAYS